ncbi:MAG: tetratricopeptide repeat protein [Longimicrobiales bacterium]|nr:tetratricopeptide repeat protein [Longimicrobiales bacterium]
MRNLSSHGRSSSRYVFKFIGTAALLILGTLILVLYVLPERYVLSSGFREGNLNLPDPTIPFEPAPPLRIAAIPDVMRGPEAGATPVGDSANVIPRGPAESFWERVLPLLEEGRNREAIPLFTDYLRRYPGDLGVRREYAVTLAAAGEGDQAISVLRDLLQSEDDDELHLLLARTLRDEGRVEEASFHYRTVVERRPADVELALEWARALSWIRDYDEARQILIDALERNPDAVVLRGELIRVLYYQDELQGARDLLNSLSDQEIRRLDLQQVQADVEGWLTSPEDTAAVAPPSLLEQALAAREADELERADSLFQAALAEEPGSMEAWTAYADYLQYERQDFERALDALRRVEELQRQQRGEGAVDSALQYRMAQLEIWTDRTGEARDRLERLLAALDQETRAGAEPTEPDSAAVSEPPAPAPTRADILALLGDLHRWDGERLAAVRRYHAALEADADHARAEEGLEALRSEVHRSLIRSEQPGMGAVASGFADTDEFRRYDVGGAWTGLHDAWVWSTTTGARWLEGIEPGGGLATREGLFAELGGARWWRWGTVRTGVELTLQNVRSNTVDVGIGASSRILGASGRRTDLGVAYEPAFTTTQTLQAVVARVWQSRLTLAHTEPLSERWTGALQGEAARLDHREVAGSDGNTRVQAALSASRPVSSVFSAGFAARALAYADAAPTVGTTLPGAPFRRLYWDPELSLSVGPFLQVERPLTAAWDLTARVNPGIAFIQERGRDSEVVSDLSARLGVRLDGVKYRTRIEIFYGQGRFSGYRSYGMDVSFSARGFFGPGFNGS